MVSHRDSNTLHLFVVIIVPKQVPALKGFSRGITQRDECRAYDNS